ncbi:MAG: hypothetical protein JNK85_21115 [Verrucomicrobiales bacterium]|nr:hypothetical protein [Verrucomicrobiales bacterium]
MKSAITLFRRATALLTALFLHVTTRGETPSEAYLVTHLTKNQQFTGRLVPSAATNLAEEILIFDCKSQKQRGPFRKKDGYQWKQDPNICDGRVIAISAGFLKELRDTPILHLADTNAYAFENPDERTMTVVIPVNFKKPETLRELSRLLGSDVLVGANFSADGKGLLTLRSAQSPSTLEKTLSVIGTDGKEREPLAVKGPVDPKDPVISVMEAIRKAPGPQH